MIIYKVKILFLCGGHELVLWVLARSRRLQNTLFLTFGLSFLCVGAASETPSNQLPTKKPIRGTIVEENIYLFETRVYWPAVDVSKASKKLLEVGITPEATVVLYLAAMFDGDYHTAMSCWELASRTIMEREDSVLNRTPSWWQEIWKEKMDGKKAELVTRIESGNYIMIEYRLISMSDREEADYYSTLALKYSDEGKWMLTQELAADPVYIYWKTPGKIRRKLVRGIEGEDAGQ